MINHFKLLILFILGLLSNLALANSNLNHYGEEESPPLACTLADYSWYQKEGPDKLQKPLVESESLFLEANSINGQIKGTSVASGNVIGYKAKQTFQSEWIIYNQKQARITGGEKFYLTRQYDAVNGQFADYYFDLEKGTFINARAYYGEKNLTATGSKIELHDSQHMSVENSYLTSCNPDDPAWYLRSSNMNFDYQDSSGSARNAVFYYESIPLFYAPYMTFPLGQRKSGFLTPLWGGSSTAGTMFGLPFYWNMAPQYDMTITPEYWTNQGFMITDQFRYMSEHNVGSIYTEQMPKSSESNIYDKNGHLITSSYRWYWSLQDTYTPYQNWSFGYNYNKVSDLNYFNDFGNFYSITDNVNLDQSVYARYSPSWGLAQVKLQNYQTLYPIGSAQTSPIYSQYPAVGFNVYPQSIGAGFKLGLTSQYTNFYNSQLQSGSRSVLYPSLIYPIQKSYAYLTPKLGYSYTYYDLGPLPNYPNTQGVQTLGLPVASVDTGLYFDRKLGLGKGNYTQTLEPRLYYLYIPKQNQASLPVFDTATATYNYNQLFSENQFSGYDRLNSANDITLGGTTRVLNDANGFELTKLALGYRYYITPRDPFLYGNQTQYSQLFMPTPNFIAELSNNWSRELTTTANFQYDNVYNNVDAYGLGMKYTPEKGKVINLGYTYQYQLPILIYSYIPGQNFTPSAYENQYAVNLSLQWPIYSNKVYVLGQANRDFTAGTWLNVVGGLEYNAGCYSISAVYQQFTYNYAPNYVQQNYMLNFNFKGIGDVGSGNPSPFLQSNIPGYMAVSQMSNNPYLQ